MPATTSNMLDARDTNNKRSLLADPPQFPAIAIARR
jgi:hypothetical protein